MSEATVHYRVAGMTCAHCEAAVRAEVAAVAGVSAVTVDRSNGSLTVSGSGISDLAVRAAVDEAGYEIVG